MSSISASSANVGNNLKPYQGLKPRFFILLATSYYAGNNLKPYQGLKPVKLPPLRARKARNNLKPYQGLKRAFRPISTPLSLPNTT
ncbi:hypothetical protein [Microcoleus sp. B3-D7]|uniref:hypothetical protein n=1 Tax=Microcoleus sp. B3-D7 TaxID=2818659 RepID=UPI00403F4897